MSELTDLEKSKHNKTNEIERKYKRAFQKDISIELTTVWPVATTIAKGCDLSMYFGLYHNANYQGITYDLLDVNNVVISGCATVEMNFIYDSVRLAVGGYFAEYHRCKIAVEAAASVEDVEAVTWSI